MRRSRPLFRLVPLAPGPRAGSPGETRDSNWEPIVADIPQISGLLSAIFRLTEAHRNEIRAQPAPGRTAAELPDLHIRRSNLSLDDFLRFILKSPHIALSGLKGCLRRLQGGSRTLKLLLPAPKVGRLVFMPSCQQSLGSLALLLIRAPSFLHGGIHFRLRVAHITIATTSLIRLKRRRPIKGLPNGARGATFCPDEFIKQDR